MKKINLAGLATAQYPKDAIERLMELDGIHLQRMARFVEADAFYDALCLEYDRKQKEYNDLYELS